MGGAVTSYSPHIRSLVATTVMYFIVLVCAALLGATTSTSRVFLKQPNSGLLLSPVGKQVVMNCTVGDELSQDWILDFPNLPDTSDNYWPHLNRHGVFIRRESRRSSEVIINTTTSIEMRVICTASGWGVFVEGNRRSITIYGPPPAPTNIKTIGFSKPGSLVFVWSLQFVNVSVNFSLTALNLNTSTNITMYTREQHLLFAAENNKSCHTYNFQVSAMADSGCSPPSEIITRSVPSIPDIALVANSTNHLLAKTSRGHFTLNVKIQDRYVCLDYPVLRYIIVLEDVYGVTQTRQVIANTTNITVDQLEADVWYTYYIRAENWLGSSDNSTSVKIRTTDVQSARILQISTTNSYSIQCSYVKGSNALGCAYVISGDGMESITGTIARNKTQGVIVDLSCYSEVLVYDWEWDGSFGTVPIPVHTVRIPCNTANSGNPDNVSTAAAITDGRNSSTAAAVTDGGNPDRVTHTAVVASVFALIAIVVVAVNIIVLLCIIKRSCQSKKNTANEVLEQAQPRNSDPNLETPPPNWHLLPEY